MKFARAVIGLVMSAIILLNSMPAVRACGPTYINPIFVFRDSPDIPFQEFIQGKIGIVRPEFGRKTLFISYRYLNGGSFTPDEQQGLDDALHAKSPEDGVDNAIKAWVEARQQYLPGDEKLREIHADRQSQGYDFFPNCTKNAFEVATETLRDRVSSHGADDPRIQIWLAGQDAVFQNCSHRGSLPEQLGPDSPQWLRHDREYQIAAALFYSLRFDEARERFSKIAADGDSPWQATANYLIARTLIRQASLSEDQEKKRALYEKAEEHLQILVGAGGKFQNASLKLQGLVKYRIHPEQRVSELARILEFESGNENLRQDLIDYTCLLDKFEAMVAKAEEERKKGADGTKQEENSGPQFPSKEIKERYDAIQRGDLIEVTFYPRLESGELDYRNWVSLDLKPDVSEAEVMQRFEERLGRKVTAEEAEQIRERYQSALDSREYKLSPNRSWDKERDLYEGCFSDCEKLPLHLFPGFLRQDDLSDWILTFRSSDPRAYNHAFSRWRLTQSPAWFIAALSKAGKDSPGVNRLLREAEKVSRNDPAFATSFYHLIRLQIELGKTTQARTMLDDMLTSQSGMLPISSQNLFLEQRMHVAENLDEFLKFALRRPVAFYYDGELGSMQHLLEVEKEYWNAQYSNQTKEEYERQTEEYFKDLLPADEQPTFDDGMIDVLNWHFPLEVLEKTIHNDSLPSHVRRKVALAAWTRAILLQKQEVALRITPEVIKYAPELTELMQAYLTAATAEERANGALFVLLKNPTLSPMLTNEIEPFVSSEEREYYFETSWWCTPSDTEYDYNGDAVPKIVSKPQFFTATQLKTAREERNSLQAIGDAKSYLGKKAIEWAKAEPNDPRIPEALFIAVQANSQYKYGCDGWSYDETTKQTAETILRNKYPKSPWTAKLTEDRY